MATAKKKTASSGTTARKAPAARRIAAKPTPTAAGTPAKRAAPDKGSEAAKTDKPHKIKVLRDSFTMPKSEFAVLQALKERAQQAGRPARKSEVLRAGVRALAGMDDAAFLAAITAVPAVKTGRPAKS